MDANRQHWWVTGGGTGIGRALAARLAAAGHLVYVSGRREEPLASLAREYPDSIIAVPMDVSDADTMAAALSAHPRAPRMLHGVVLSAGVCEYIDLPDFDVATLRRVMEVNYFGVANCIQVALPLLGAVPQGEARPQLVGISSMSAWVGFPRAEAYGSAKAAMSYLLDSLRCDVRAWLDVTVVYPGFVDTPLTRTNDFPMPFLIDVDEAAATIAQRLGQGRRVIAFPWQLGLILRFASWFPGLWYGPVMERMTRARAVHP